MTVAVETQKKVRRKSDEPTVQEIVAVLHAIEETAHYYAPGVYYIYGVGSLKKAVQLPFGGKIFQKILLLLQKRQLISPEIPLQQMPPDVQAKLRARYQNGGSYRQYAHRYAIGHAQLRCIRCYLDQVKKFRSELAKSTPKHNGNGNGVHKRLP